MDLDSIEPGVDFAEVIRAAVNSCAVLVALIGRQWATLADKEGQRRLDNPDDFVRFEVQAALEGDVRVIPVLVDDASPLRQQELPPELQKLARLQVLELSSGRYDYDVNQLLSLIQRVLATRTLMALPTSPRPGRVRIPLLPLRLKPFRIAGLPLVRRLRKIMNRPATTQFAPPG